VNPVISADIAELKVTLADVIELLSRERDHERPAGRRSD
jgi:hypothetical protein